MVNRRNLFTIIKYILEHRYQKRTKRAYSPRAAKNQEVMAKEGGIDMLIVMLESPHPHLQRQSSKALANLGVNAMNKERICKAGGVPPLVRLAGSNNAGVAVEAVAALANLAVNGEQ